VDPGLMEQKVELTRAGITQLALDHDRRLEDRGGRDQAHRVPLDRVGENRGFGLAEQDRDERGVG
jgi:hypothetical protein